MAAPTARQTVLLVDDERNLVRVLEARLRREGYSTLAAYDGAEALTVLRRYPVHVVVLDVRMSGLGGPETLKAIHAIQPDLPVVLMSAYGKPEGLPEAVVYLEKPFNLDVLISIVANALKLRRVPSSVTGLSLFVPGQTLRLVVPDEEGLWYGQSSIQNETCDTLEVTAPVKDGRVLTPAVNSAVRVTVTGGDGLYSFNTRVHVATSGPGACLVLWKPDIIERHQRRTAPRFRVTWPVQLEVLPPTVHARPLKLSSAWQSLDASETGMRLSGEGTVPADSDVLFQVSVPSRADPIQGRARVVWDTAVPNERYTMGLQFIGLDSDNRSALQVQLGA